MAGAIELVSVDLEGSAGNDTSDNPAISADGRVVAFASFATNLVPDDDNGFGDIFVRDREGGVTELVSVGVGGAPADGRSVGPSISADGRFVAFASDASNLVALNGNDESDVFVRDRENGSTLRVSVDSAGNEGNAPSGWGVAISGDGQFVAFASLSTNLVAGDTNDAQDIFVRDLASGTTERVSVSTDGEEGNADSLSLGSPPAISADGRFVAFESFASNLVEGDTNGIDDVFVHDRESGTTVRVSVDADGNEGDSYSFSPAISADGRFVAFASISSTLVPNDDNFSPDIFVKDLATGAIERVSVSATGVEGDGASFEPAISADGRFVAFASDATNLVPDDTNELTDLFVVDREAGTIARISVGTEGQQANESSFRPALSADGALAAFLSFASNFGFEVGSGNGTGDVYLATTGLVPPSADALPPLAEKVPLPDSEIHGAPLFLVGESGDAEIAFVDEYAAFQSSLGVYLVGPDGTIGATDWVFDRIEHSEASDLASAGARPGGGPLAPGDAVLLSDLFAPEELAPGTGFGLFLVADGWALNDAAIFDEGSLAFRSNGGPASVTDTTPDLVYIAANGTETLVLGDILHTVDADSANPQSNTLNPGGTGQVTSGLLDGAFTVAFEDKPLGQNSDRDFNDALFAVDALNTTPPIVAQASDATSAVPVSFELQTLVPEATDAAAA